MKTKRFTARHIAAINRHLKVPVSDGWDMGHTGIPGVITDAVTAMRDGSRVLDFRYGVTNANGCDLTLVITVEPGFYATVIAETRKLPGKGWGKKVYRIFAWCRTLEALLNPWKA